MRRAFKTIALLAMSTALLIGTSACQGDPPTLTPASANPADAASSAGAAAEDGEQLTLEVLNTELALGLERFSFLLKDANGNPIRDGNARVRFFRILPQSGESVNAADGEALYFGVGMPNGGSWVAYTEFDASGPWGLEVELTRSDGRKGLASMEVDVQGKTDTPRVGQAPPAVELPRLTEGGDLGQLTSDPNPLEALYTTSLIEARDSGRPSVILLASPAHCPTDMCRAALSALKSLQGTYASRVNFLHFETHDLADPTQFSAAYEAWGLPSEPWFFFLDARGLVASRVEGGLDNTELDLLIRLALGEQVTKPQP